MRILIADDESTLRTVIRQVISADGFEVTEAASGEEALEIFRAEPFPIDQKGFRFIPHVTVIQTGSAVRFLNNDNEPHNVYSPEGSYNLVTWPTGDTRDHVFKKPGIYTQLCNIHPDMLAYVVVVDTPHFALTDATGAFLIRNVPPGKYRLVVWHEKKDGLEQDVEV